MTEIYYRIMDNQGHFADNYSFTQDKHNKWLYISQQGYVWGTELFTEVNTDLVDTLHYLQQMNQKFNLDKKFYIVAVPKDNLEFGGKTIIEEFYPNCCKCDNEFNYSNQAWTVKQQGMYGSKFDGEMVEVRVCNSCFEEMFDKLIKNQQEFSHLL